ncbi:PadR family transcriptional regulator [Micromonospora matsumotoense]|uniref:PadR family transcriptional regulator n=1 Tax=Micromonospora matsumotoense TaxID=121616 RepID=UPI0033F54997
MGDEAWPSEWLRGVLGPAVLSILSEREAYGYLIAQRLEQGGLGHVKGGTLYPLLARYEAAGLLESSWQEGDGGPGRKFFTITEAGAAELSGLRERWAAFSHRAGALINPEEAMR